MGIVALAFELMAFIVLIYILMAVVGWQALKLVFGWGQKHCNWTAYPNLNGVLFILAIFGGWVILSVPVGIISPKPTVSTQTNPWETLLFGMGITGGTIIGLGLVALGIFIIVLIIRGLYSWLFDSRK